jgi:phosphate transport system substrate-binding protein
MSLARSIGALSLAAGLSLALTACDPPIPQELLVAQAELSVQCEEGSVSLSVPEALYDTSLSWVDAVSLGCESMTIELLDDPTEPADLVISAMTPTAERCKPFLTVPGAFDAGVLVVNLPDVYELNLSADQIVRIFNGEITNWSDEQLSVNNEELIFPDLPIILPTQATSLAKNSIADWISRLAEADLDLSTISEAEGISEIELATPAEEGAIGIASFSAASYLGSTIVGIVTESGNLESLVIPQYETLYSGITQMVSSFSSEGLKVSLDPTLEPLPEAGLSEAAAPFQSAYALNLYLCGEDSTLTRTAARFVLRQDSQGLLAGATFMPLREEVRISAIELVVVGLPTPTIEPTDP